MATPTGGTPQVWILQDVNPVAVIQQQPESVPYLLANADLTNNVYVSTSNNVGPGGANSYTIAPLGSIAISSAAQWWACTDPGATTELDVLPGGSSESPAPAQIAEVIAPLAAAIAEEIFTTGIQTVAAPSVIYNVGSTGSGGSGSAGLVGGTTPAQAFQQAGCYDFGHSQVFCDNQFTGFVARAGAGGHLTVTKKFWNQSDWSLTKNDLANYAAFGTKVIFALKPVAPPFGAITNAEKTNLTNFLNSIIGMGFNATTAEILLWQEANNGNNFGHGGQAQYAAMLAAYGPIVNAAGLPLMVSTGASAGNASCDNFLNAALGVGGITLQGYYVDLYFGAWNSAGFNAANAFTVADAALLPCGFSEIGCHISDNFTAYFTQAANPPGIIPIMQNRLQAGKSNLSVVWYQGQCSATGVGDLSQPILSSTDPRIPVYQQMFDTLTASSGGAGIVLPHGAFKTIVPVSPSPIGGLGPCGQLSYEIAVGLEAGAGSTNPFAQVILGFFDFDQVPANQQVVSNPAYRVPLGANGDAKGPSIITGKGRLRGGFMRIQIKNDDSVDATLQLLQVVGVGRNDNLDDWGWDSANSPAIPGFVLPGGVFSSLQLGHNAAGGDVLTAGGAGDTITYLLSMFAGQVFVRYTQSGASSVTFNLVPQPASEFGTQALSSLTLTNGQEEETVVFLPRAPCALKIINNDGVNAATVRFSIIALKA